MRAYVVGTLDTKGAELRYVRDRIADAGVDVTLVDVSTSGGKSEADVTPAEVAEQHPAGSTAVFTGDRGSSVEAMSEALTRFVLTRPDLGGIIGAGGSGATALVTPAMRALPVGVPKVMVSTVASGDVGMYVGPADIAMMYSVTDVAGLNRISREVLGNAAHALAGMVRHRAAGAAGVAGAADQPDDRPLVGLTMFGVTTPLVTRLSRALEPDFEPLVFHATGTGGQSMEKLVDSGLITAVLDMTTTEIADHLVGGVFSAGPDRLGAIARTGVPYVGSVGAVDMVNFGPLDTVPPQFRDRRLHVHNPQVTLMRTTPVENVAIGAFIAEALNRCHGPVRFLLPEGGVSLIDAPGQPFHDPDADAALFDTIERSVVPTRDRVVERVAGNINDDAFADRVLEHFGDIVAVRS
jgi:uncharacterized protein (UPF0261 family)